MTFKNKLLSLIAALTIITGVCFSVINIKASAAVSGALRTMESFKDPNGSVIGVSSKGAWGEYPENSLEAVKKAALMNIDFILVDIKKTSDGELILFSDDTTDRMLSADFSMTVSETDYETLSLYNLRQGCGGASAAESTCKIPTLKAVAALSVEMDFPLMLRTNAVILPDAVRALSDAKALDTTVIIVDGRIEEIKAALELCSEKPNIAGKIRSNIIFSVNSFISDMESLRALGAELKSSNRYGINYQPTVLKHYCRSIRLIADPTVPDECGARIDSEKWWNDLISRGYSVIITDYPDIFSEYLSRTVKARERLQKAYDKYAVNNILPEFKNKYLNNYKKAYSDATMYAQKLLADGSSPVQELDDAYSLLIKSVNDIAVNFTALEDGSAGTTFTVPRIIICICAAVAVIAVQIFFFKKRKKKDG